MPGAAGNVGARMTTWTFDGGGEDRGYAVTTDSADNVIVVGKTENATNSDIWIRKHTP
jgi:hypothetical protein